MWETLLPIVVDQLLVPLVIAPFLIWLFTALRAQFGINVESKHREALQSALENGALYALDLLIERGGRLDLQNPDAVKQMFDDAADYVFDSVPDALNFFGIDGARLHKLLRPKMPVLTEEEARDLVEEQTGVRPTGPVTIRSSSPEER